MAKLMVHKTDNVESVVLNGVLENGANGLIVKGESGDMVDLGDIFEDFVDCTITLSIKQKETEEIQVVE